MKKEKVITKFGSVEQTIERWNCLTKDCYNNPNFKPEEEG